MNVHPASATALPNAWLQPAPAQPPSAIANENEAGAGGNHEALREAFQSFVGQTLFGQLLGAMRKTVGEPAYFHGGRAEEIFQGQLDQVLAEKMADASADKLSGPMLELFELRRK